MQPLTDWSYCKPITVQHAYIDADITNVPYVVYITSDTDIGAHALANGYDLRFTSADGTTVLGYWRRSFTIAAGAATGICHILVPALATAGGDIIYCHYGNAAAPDVSSKAASQGANTKRYWPLNEAYSTAAGNYKDVMGIGDLTLTDADADSGQGTGPIDFAVDLNGDWDYLTDADHADHDPGGAMTIESWFVSNETRHTSTLLRHAGTSYENGYGLQFWDGVNGANKILHGRLSFPSGDKYIGNNASVLSADTEYYAVLTFDRTLPSDRAILYVNGISIQTDNCFDEDIVSNANGFIIGMDAWGAFLGRQAEIRYSKVAFSAALIKFIFRNITEADHEQTWGAEEIATFDLVPAENAQVQVIDVPTLVVTHVLAPIELSQSQAIDGPITIEVQSTDNMKYTARKNTYNIMR